MVGLLVYCGLYNAQLKLIDKYNAHAYYIFYKIIIKFLIFFDNVVQNIYLFIFNVIQIQ